MLAEAVGLGPADREAGRAAREEAEPAELEVGIFVEAFPWKEGRGCGVEERIRLPISICGGRTTAAATHKGVLRFAWTMGGFYSSKS